MPEKLPNYDNWKLAHDERVEGDESDDVAEEGEMPRLHRLVLDIKDDNSQMEKGFAISQKLASEVAVMEANQSWNAAFDLFCTRLANTLGGHTKQP